MYKRLFKPNLRGQSFFLFGPRQTGKSTLIENLIYGKNVFKIDFLEVESVFRYKTDPALFRAEVEKFIQSHPADHPPVIFVDEVQKVPEILDGVHLLLHRYPQAQFILTGSSARKIKRDGANLLAGRALEYQLHPLTFLEMGERFDLNTQLGRGSLPPVVDLSLEDAEKVIKSYSGTYLKEEIMSEALVRNVVPFNRFLEIAADQSGNLINYSNVARDVGVASKTIQDYYQILEDTLIIFRLLPYLKGTRKQLIHQSKYYLFDLGLTNYLSKRSIASAVPGTSLYGRQFEHFMILEMIRLAHSFEKNFSFYHWRTTTQAEVDLVIEGPDLLLACEIKSKNRLEKQDLKGLIQFKKDYPKARTVCLGLIPHPYDLEGIEIWPWKEFLLNLYGPAVPA